MHLLLLISSSSCSLCSRDFFHINHLNLHTRATAEGLCPVGIVAVVSKKATPSYSSGSCPAKERVDHREDAHCPLLSCFLGVCTRSPPRLGPSACPGQAALIYYGDAARPTWHSSPPSPPSPRSLTRIPSPQQLKQIGGQRRNVRNEPLTGSGLGIRQCFTAPLPPAAAPSPQPSIPPSMRHLSLPHSTTAPQGGPRFTLTGTQRDSSSKSCCSSLCHALELVMPYLAHALSPRGACSGGKDITWDWDAKC